MGTIPIPIDLSDIFDGFSLFNFTLEVYFEAPTYITVFNF
jgi:hypothetical protein